MDGSFGGGRGSPVGGGARCQRGKTVATIEMSAPISRSPGLDARALHEVVAPYEGALLRCYEQEACPQLLPYSMRACFTIDADGSVSTPDADSVNANIRTCVVGVLRSLRFPRPVQGAALDVTYSMTFRSK